jgi:hypothetical protein
MPFLRTITPPDAESLVDYFDETYVTGNYRRFDANGTVTRFRRIPAKFPPYVWNVYEATLSAADRTNNQSEGWNHKHLHIVGHKHPTIWRSIAAFQADNATVATSILQNATGNPPKKKVKRATQDYQKRLHNLCLANSQKQKTTEEFLRGVGHAIRYKNN